MDSANGVFYDEAQVHNRGISIAVLRTFISKRKEEHAIMLSRKGSASEVPCDGPSDYLSDGDCQIQLDSSDYTKGNLREIQEIPASKVQELKAPTVLEALAASGLRSRRYALEIDGIGKIVTLDYDECINLLKLAKEIYSLMALWHHQRWKLILPMPEFICLPIQKNFMRMVQLKTIGRALRLAIKQFSTKSPNPALYKSFGTLKTDQVAIAAVDLDPYGSPSAFLDSAVQSIADGGLLMCTATDLSIWVTGMVLIPKYHHEMALRILLACVEEWSARMMKIMPLKLSCIYQCAGCDSFHLQSLGRTVTKVSYKSTAMCSCNSDFGSCLHYLEQHRQICTSPVVPQKCTDCGWNFSMGGPTWSAPIPDQEWVASMLQNVKAAKDKHPGYKKIVVVLIAISEVDVIYQNCFSFTPNRAPLK
ncbi:hypothetical protein C4D60_Mb06t25630 [Musa balbisiana]|uniref:tRNA (guanine(26)-N(2))-dimethyltransferase n=1 Tax=Musa balbisiana TaxID=52838 RepID=A0A4S8IRW3_MUSBA|nr:hypothetical protein C4D60_Mb06t25630 [Musa balbisiana]